ncbi:MAG: MBL fold metallo-hydrolase [Planctomycetes bacterium]|nr:MBL fold metallo-hydrolase [Planctomycetota bacterium]
MDIKLKFLGAAQNVTGSRYLVEAGGTRLLVDCGLYQERALQARNWDPFPVPAATIDAVLLTHAHLDHCGLLPKLYREGFRGPIHCTAATAEIARIVLADAASLQEEDARLKRKRHEREGRKGPYPEAPLYTREDAAACAGQFAPVGYGQAVRIADGIEAVFFNVGHILGASFIRLSVDQGAERRTIVFSGDVGRWDRPILKDPERPEQADYLLIESTYGDRQHPGGKDCSDALAAAVNAAHKAGGNVVIPTFALERSQDVLYCLNRLLLDGRMPQLPTFLDSPMAIRVTEVFEHHGELFDEETRDLVRQHNSPFDLPGLRLTRTTEESKAINHLKGTALIMAGSGMCTGGRVKHHLAHNISRPESTILFVGYQAQGTLGRIIVDGAKEVRIYGRTYRVRAKVARIEGFSAHADRDELLQWLSGMKAAPRRAFVVHGEPDSARHFAGLLHERMKWKTSVPTYGEEATLD